MRFTTRIASYLRTTIYSEYIGDAYISPHGHVKCSSIQLISEVGLASHQLIKVEIARVKFVLALEEGDEVKCRLRDVAKDVANLLQVDFPGDKLLLKRAGEELFVDVARDQLIVELAARVELLHVLAPEVVEDCSYDLHAGANDIAHGVGCALDLAPVDLVVVACDEVALVCTGEEVPVVFARLVLWLVLRIRDGVRALATRSVGSCQTLVLLNGSMLKATL